MLCDVVRRRRRRRRRWAHAPVIHAASHFDHKKRVAWVSISMHTCGSFFYNYGAPLGGPSGRRSSAIIWHTRVMHACFLLKRTSGHLGFLRVFLMTRATKKKQATTSLKTNSMNINHVEYKQGFKNDL